MRTRLTCWLVLLCVVLVGGADRLDSQQIEIPETLQVERALQPETRDEDMVRIGSSLDIPENLAVKSAVAIWGDADVRGLVREDLVVIGGNLKLSGTVAGEVVVIGGSAQIAGSARIEEGLVSVGARTVVDENAVVRGDRVVVGEFLSGAVVALKSYATCCLFKGRLVAPELPWTVWIMAALILVALILALLFRGTALAAITLLETRPAVVLLAGLATVVGIAPLSVALSATIVGIPALPFLWLAASGLALIGMFAVFSFVGGTIVREVFRVATPPTFISGILGGAIFVGLAMVPVLGIIVVSAVKLLGIGAGVLPVFEAVRRAGGQKPKQEVPPGPAPGDSTQSSPPQSPPPAAPSQPPPVSATSATVPAALDTERPATLWERLGGAVIDFILVAFVYGVSLGPFFRLLPGVDGHDWTDSFRTVLFLGYLAVFWAWRATSVGGIVFHLKVKRVSGEPMTRGVAVVRALGLVLSVLPLGLGFWWMAWDSQKQTWHDKIAGTEVVRVPSGVRIV